MSLLLIDTDIASFIFKGSNYKEAIGSINWGDDRFLEEATVCFSEGRAIALQRYTAVLEKHGLIFEDDHED